MRLPLPLVAAPLALNIAQAEPLRQPNYVSFHDAVERAWSLMPERGTYQARLNTAAARATSGHALFPNAPSLTARHINDKILGSNQNYITTEAELGTPIWLPGEGSATVATANAESATAESDLQAAHLALAGQVLELSVRAEAAVRTRIAAVGRLAVARGLAADADRRARIGEQPETNALAADAEAAGAETDLASAETEEVSARADLAAITGLETVPTLPSSPARQLGRQSDILERHPRILAAERVVEAAEAQARLVRLADRDDPELGLQATNEKQPGTRWDTRVGVTLHFYFATEARNAPRRAEAEQQVTQAMVQLALARREVLTSLRAQTASLIGAERAAPSARRAADAQDSRRAKIERAWRLGEAPLIEVIRAGALAYGADLTRDRTDLALRAARLRMQLAEGDLP